MSITSFHDLLQSALDQVEPQRLLFIFTRADVPDDATHEQRQRFDAGAGGTLTPLMCVDKSPHDLPSFAALLAESRQFGQIWDIAFAGALAGAQGLAPTNAQVETALERMVESIKAGRIGAFIPFDICGRLVEFG